MTRNRRSATLVTAITVSALLIGGVGFANSDRMQSAFIQFDGEYGELLTRLESPTGEWIARMYVREEGGPTSDTWTTVEVVRRGQEKPRAVYSAPNRSTDMLWVTPDILRVGGQDIAVSRDTYLRFW